MTKKKFNLPIQTPQSDYDVGYGKPPKSSQFKPGQSGNPRGRPRGAKNKRPALHEERLKDIILDEAYRDITVRDGDRNVSIPMAQAIIRSMAVNAAKGQHRAQRLFAELLASVESANRMLNQQFLESSIEYKVEWEKELRRREALAITDLPAPLPHPDHVKIDFRTGIVSFVGPITAEEKKEYDDLVQTKQVLRDELEELTQLLAIEKDPKEREDIKRAIALAEESIAYILRAIPD